MHKSLEYKIRWKAAIIYAIVAIGVVATIVYLHRLRGDVAAQRAQIAQQRTLLSKTNELLFRVGEAQSFSSLYLSLKNSSYLTEYTRSLDSIGTLMETICALKSDKAEYLRRIDSLLREQARNIVRLNRQFAGENPVAVISERIRKYDPDVVKDTLHIVTLQQDTLISERPRKSFFKRLGEVFKPDRKPLKIAVSHRTDTIRTPDSESPAIIQEVGDIAQKAQGVYDEQIRTIEKRVGRLVATDKDIAAEISALLLDLHEDALESTLAIIERSERKIDRNYVYSTIGGVVALVLILVFIALIITDINKGAQARRALMEANERIRQVMESRHRLLLSVSHDIKTPLNSITGYLGQMEGHPGVRSMRNSSAHILSLLENLLEFSSLERGTVQKSLSDFNLRELCAELFDMFLPLAQQKQLAFSFEADDVRISTDRVKIKQILTNIVSNGIKYTARGEVTWSARFDGRTLHIAVRDTGAGIPAECLPQLFKPFSRVERNNALAEGTGFGMFVVKGLVELLGGKVGIESEVGAGTEVQIAIPVAPARREIPQGEKRICLHDDDPALIRMLSDMLRKLGHKVVESDCDLILTDLEMGEISGLDILREAGGKPVVVMTGRTDFTDTQAREMGFDGFLAKPFSQEALREVVGDGVRPDQKEAADDDLLGDDREAILGLFRTSTEANFDSLRHALTDENFPRAQALCHKMFPMFAQLGYPVEELRRMDLHREKPYEGWREDVEKILAIKV